MRIALTYNLKLSDTEEDAEFDSEETVDALATSMERLGHRVERVEVSGPASRTVVRLEAFSPDLIFNTAEGRRGRFREAFYPALFDQLGFPYTGSDAYSLAVTLDKQLTKLILRDMGVCTPSWQFVERLSDLRSDKLCFPVIIKPNFEGSSKGITQNSVVESLDTLKATVQRALSQYPAGVLVEGFIVGRDLAVPFLESMDNDCGGVLDPVEYVISQRATQGRAYGIFDFDYKTLKDEAIRIHAPAHVELKLSDKLRKTAKVIYQKLDCKDLSLIDFRLSEDGVAYFLEVNALPSLHQGAGIFASAALDGLHYDGVIDGIIQSASRRFKIRDKPRSLSRPARRGPLKVGFTFNVKRIKPTTDGIEDREAEYDSPSTLQVIREAIASHGHEVIDLEATPELPMVLATAPVDIVFNIAEGFRGRNRESQVPALLELLDIPYTGSDPTTLSLALDKALAKKVVRAAGIITPNFQLMHTGRERLDKQFTHWPLMVKPVAEGSSKGVVQKSVCCSEPELRETVQEILDRYKQPALVEEYIGGREFTVGLLGERRPEVLPPMEIIFTDESDSTPIYKFEDKLETNNRIRYEAPAKLDSTQLERMRAAARAAFMALGCRDVARIDFRMDKANRIFFLECNPLPGLTPGWSDLVLIAQSDGMNYHTLIGEILSGAIRRYKEKAARRRDDPSTGRLLLNNQLVANNS